MALDRSCPEVSGAENPSKSIKSSPTVSCLVSWSSTYCLLDLGFFLIVSRSCKKRSRDRERGMSRQLCSLDYDAAILPVLTWALPVSTGHVLLRLTGRE